MIDIVRDYTDLSRGLVGPLTRRAGTAAAAGAAAAGRLAIHTSLRVASLASRPLRAVIR